MWRRNSCQFAPAIGLVVIRRNDWSAAAAICNQRGNRNEYRSLPYWSKQYRQRFRFSTEAKALARDRNMPGGILKSIGACFKWLRCPNPVSNAAIDAPLTRGHRMRTSHRIRAAHRMTLRIQGGKATTKSDKSDAAHDPTSLPRERLIFISPAMSSSSINLIEPIIAFLTRTVEQS